MKSIRSLLISRGRALFIALVLFVLVATPLLYKLGSLQGGMSTTETALPSVTHSLHVALHDPLELPLLVTRIVVALISPTAGQTVSRLPNAILGGIAVLLFYWLARRWYGLRVALYGTALFLASPWFLRVARLATSDIVYVLGMLLFIALFIALPRYGNRQWLLYLSAILFSGLLYIPGFVWFILVLLIAQRRVLKEIWKVHGGWVRKPLWLILALATLAPLVWALIRNSRLLTTWAGLPSHLPHPITLAHHLRDTVLSIFVHSNLSPTLSLGHLPLLDALSIALFVIGLVFYGRHPKAARLKLLGSLFIIGLALVTIGGPVPISILLPLVFIIISGGIAYLLHEWLSVFPRNPVARGFGFGLLAIVLLLGIGYDLRQYFVAWPHNKRTQANFQVTR